MAGVPGFEPGMPVSKTGALTTWLYPIIITDFLKEEYFNIREARFELAHLTAPEPKSGASTYFATPATNGGYDGN